MNSERWQKVKSLFEAALEVESKKRRRFLDNACGDNGELRREVEKLLDSFKDDNFMEKPAAEEVASLIVERNSKLKDGEVIAHYKILSQIGAGGMGEVYLAQDKKLDRKVAIKILNDQFSRHESNLQRFTQEAKAASALNHPNILVIHEIGESEDAHYIVSEFVEGKTLREIIQMERQHLVGNRKSRQDDGVPTLSEVLDIQINAAGGLQRYFIFSTSD